MFKKFEPPLEMGIVRYFSAYFNSRLAKIDITINEATLDILEDIAQKIEDQHDIENTFEKHIRIFYSIPDTVTDLRVWVNEQGKDYDGMSSSYNVIENIFKQRIQNGFSRHTNYLFKNININEQYYL